MNLAMFFYRTYQNGQYIRYSKNPIGLSYIQKKYNVDKYLFSYENKAIINPEWEKIFKEYLLKRK